VTGTTRCEKYELIYEEKSKVKAILVYLNSDVTMIKYDGCRQYGLLSFLVCRGTRPRLGVDCSNAAFGFVQIHCKLCRETFCTES
jgi:hypothetical protein